MARSARSSGIKKNKAALKKRVFGPVETARNERLSAKLLELANAPKEKMEVEETKPEETKATEGTTEDVDMEATPRRSKREVQRRKSAQAAKFERKSNKKPRNQVSFPSHPRKKKTGKK